MKKLLLLVAMAILIGMFVSGGYALAGSESKANVKTITLNYAAVNPMTGFEGKVFQWAFDEVEKRTEGRVKIQVFRLASSTLYLSAFSHTRVITSCTRSSATRSAPGSRARL